MIARGVVLMVLEEHAMILQSQSLGLLSRADRVHQSLQSSSAV